MSAPAIVKVSGPTVLAAPMHESSMNEVVRVGPGGLMGEIIRIERGRATIQVYEDTAGLKIGDPVERTERPLTVQLGPGLLGSIFDGIQRPLPELARRWGSFVKKGADVPPLDKEKKWRFTPSVQAGDTVSEGMVLGEVPETERIVHKIMTPEGFSGTVESIEEGEFTIEQTVAVLEGGREITLATRSSIRRPRKSGGKLPFTVPLITGQRVLDTLFPVAEGGAAIIPGGFGTGKTVLEQTLAKFALADVIIYIGCGERGNEMADVLNEFPELEDPYTGRSLMERTVLIANTSNMPVAAREASIYTAMTMAEYYRDMGYRVAVMADSTSRWAEALREISSRMEEMPGEEGYPPYLASRLGVFYERAARARCLGRPDESGSITVVGAVSPPGGDFSEPVTQASMRMGGAFWALDYDLAHRRHFPAINWLTSFSLYHGRLSRWFRHEMDEQWQERINELNEILQRDEELEEVVKIVGLDAMGDRERLEIEAATLLREGYLRQNSFSDEDAFCPLKKQKIMLELILDYIGRLKHGLREGVSLDDLVNAPEREAVLRLREAGEDGVAKEADRIREETDRYLKEKQGHD